MTNFSESLHPPYFAAVVTPKNGDRDKSGILSMEQMSSLAPRLDGFLGLETAKLEDGTGAAICYWRSSDAVVVWKFGVLTRLIGDLNLKHRRLEDALAISGARVARRLFPGRAKPSVFTSLLTRGGGDTSSERRIQP
ncbi:MAG: hypothetical protein VW268_03625 [Rhodospirillaceae bacterium]